MSASQTIGRQWALLKTIPRHPGRITVTELESRLADAGYRVDRRTLQRDLASLEREFPITCELEGRTHHWFWARDARHLDIPKMTLPMAVAFLMARDYLKPILPASVLGELQGHFDHAADVLAGTPLQRWQDKVRLLERGPMQIPPTISAAVREAVYAGLLADKQLRVRYQALDRDQPWSYVVNPLGLTVKTGIHYLVGTINEYDDIRQFALHRMRSATALDTDLVKPAAFSLKRYIEDEAGFEYPVSPAKIRIELLVDEHVGKRLQEARLSPDQECTPGDDGRLRVSATVADTDELRTWLRGFGSLVEVVKPASVRKELHTRG